MRYRVTLAIVVGCIAGCGTDSIDPSLNIVSAAFRNEASGPVLVGIGTGPGRVTTLELSPGSEVLAAWYGVDSHTKVVASLSSPRTPVATQIEIGEPAPRIGQSIEARRLYVIRIDESGRFLVTEQKDGLEQYDWHPPTNAASQ
jgi:hypothetical protein